MPVEVGEVFFLCMAHDQSLEAQDRLEAVARQKQAELVAELMPRPYRD